nr:hypothetical protein [Candidatus Desulforudis audaxviator]
MLDGCPKQLRGELKHRLHGLFNAPDLETARTLLDGMIADYEGRAPRALEPPWRTGLKTPWRCWPFRSLTASYYARPTGSSG